MAGKIRHMVERSGRYHARLVVPKELRKIVGKTELRTPLGGDYKTALKMLPGAVARLQYEIAQAEQKAGQGAGTGQARYPLSPEQLAFSHYSQRLAFDDELRNDPRYAAVGIDDQLVARLCAAVAGRANDPELADLVGRSIELFRRSSNLDANQGSLEWRMIARALCHAELEALARVAERDDGDFSGTPTDPMILAAAVPVDRPQKVSLTALWADYVSSRVQIGAMRDGGKRQAPVIASLRKFLGHDDAARVQRRDLLAWRDCLLVELSAKTVNDIYLSTARSLFAWAVENERLPENVAVFVKQPKPKKVHARERGYTLEEALEVLRASRAYAAKPDRFGKVREGEKSVNMKRWVPLLCAHTGARVGEIVQLRKQDVREVSGRWVLRITPDAGTVKAGDYRDVPLHPQVIDEGFVTFVEACGDGPLFHNETDPGKYRNAVKIVGNKLSDWLRVSGLTPAGVQPNHGWRHAFKTRCRENGISDRVADAIQGHAGRTAGDSYGDVTLKTKIGAVDRLPAFELKAR